MVQGFASSSLLTYRYILIHSLTCICDVHRLQVVVDSQHASMSGSCGSKHTLEFGTVDSFQVRGHAGTSAGSPTHLSLVDFS